MARPPSDWPTARCSLEGSQASDQTAPVSGRSVNTCFPVGLCQIETVSGCVSAENHIPLGLKAICGAPNVPGSPKVVDAVILLDIPNFGNACFGNINDRLPVGQKCQAVPALVHVRGIERRLPPRGNVPRFELVFVFRPNQKAELAIEDRGEASAAGQLEFSLHMRR